MKDRRAIVLPETIKIIIAVACIVLLIYLAVKLYSIFTRGHELDTARAVLNDVAGKLNALNNNQSYAYLVIGPKKWNFIFYQQQKKLCICPPGTYDLKQAELCTNQGICRDIIFNLNAFTGICASSIKSCYSLDEVPAEFTIRNTDGVYEIITHVQKQDEDLMHTIFSDDKYQTTVWRLFNVDTGQNIIADELILKTKINELLPDSQKQGHGWKLDITRTSDNIVRTIDYAYLPSGYTQDGKAEEIKSSFTKLGVSYNLKLTIVPQVYVRPKAQP